MVSVAVPTIEDIAYAPSYVSGDETRQRDEPRDYTLDTSHKPPDTSAL